MGTLFRGKRPGGNIPGAQLPRGNFKDGNPPGSCFSGGNYSGVIAWGQKVQG